MIDQTLFRYWGKAKQDESGNPLWHPLVYHSLDVAAVAAAWWDSSLAIRRVGTEVFQIDPKEQSQLLGWILFFIALHDLGKFDIRFQLKAPEVLVSTGLTLKTEDHSITLKEIHEFNHGHAGFTWAIQEHQQWLQVIEADSEVWDRCKFWFSAVTGHHGDLYESPIQYLSKIEADEKIIRRDQIARFEFVSILADLFLKPVGLTLQDLPPLCSLTARLWLAGFCSISDWIGSNTNLTLNLFKYKLPELSAEEYFKHRLSEAKAEKILQSIGILSTSQSYSGVQTLLEKSESPRGVQILIDSLTPKPGLTLIEAPTGSGKTEAALAYAWRLLDQGEADSIVFALPTQATANAMLERVERFAEKTFGNAHLVLAHGKSKLNPEFNRLIIAGKEKNAQGVVEARVQCAEWLSSSRKRVFLGQMGVCTIDQVLLSVLPVKHKFVRSFGISKSVLIVDEVHAYDAYMNGLLGELLRHQKTAGGSVILLSATLPAKTRQELFTSWGIDTASMIEKAPYPALWHSNSENVSLMTLPENQSPPRREVEVECLKLAKAFPDDAVIQRILNAAESGADVAVVMNLVDETQRLARLLQNKTSVPIDVFHSRYRFIDRQEKEKNVLEKYGRKAPRGKTGRILVATQVIEQSLDLDFDWMITQICPVDLLFQRLGRLHRHPRQDRPAGYAVPRCTVLSVENENYDLHKLIYENARVLWRTEQLLLRTNQIVFPESYRSWIDQVYERDDWENEPEKISEDFDSFHSTQISRKKDAKQLTTMSIKVFLDEDARITSLTRDSEMSLSVLLFQSENNLLDGHSLNQVAEEELSEVLSLNEIPVPSSKSWRGNLEGSSVDQTGKLAGYYQLKMISERSGEWKSENSKLRYSKEFGLEKIHHELTE